MIPIETVTPLGYPGNYRHDPIVYYLGAENAGVIKIGTTVNMGSRFKRIAKNAPGVAPVLYAWEYGDEMLERERHKRFRDSSYLIGEWHIASPMLVEWLHHLRWLWQDDLPPGVPGE